LFDISILLDVQANLPETSPFLFAQMALVSTFIQMFIVLGMYNFVYMLDFAVFHIFIGYVATLDPRFFISFLLILK
jgi:hypothetical protein